MFENQGEQNGSYYKQPAFAKTAKGRLFVHYLYDRSKVL